MNDVLETAEAEEDEIVSKEIFPYDPADDLISDEGIAYFIEGAFETGDPEFIAHALGVAARAKGMMQIAEQTGLSREQLALSSHSKNTPSFQSALEVMKALGIGVATKVIERSQAYN